MCDNKKMYYKAFGYNIMSELIIPELSEVIYEQPFLGLIDIEVRKGDLTNLWNQMAEQDDYYVANEDIILFKVTNYAIYSIEGGRVITASPIGDIDDNRLQNYILGTCMTAVLLQRRIIPLHGSAINMNGKVYVFTGHSGAGKSTLASAFISKGYKMLSDDVVAISCSADQPPQVIPSFPTRRLWEESMDMLGIQSDQPHRRLITATSVKHSIPALSHFTTEKLPLAGIFELVISENDRVSIHPVIGLKKIHTLFKHTFRKLFINPMGLTDWHFMSTTHLANRIPLFQIKRPRHSFSVNELISVIIDTINKAEASADREKVGAP